MNTRLRLKNKRSFPEHEGKVIKWTNPEYGAGQPYEVKITGCDYYIGCTMVNIHDLTDNFTCINGPLSPKYKNKPMNQAELKLYNKKFAILLQFINKGHYDIGLKNNILGTSSCYNGTMNKCSFNE